MEKKYITRFAITDPKSRLGSAEYWVSGPYRESLDDCIELGNRIVKELQKCHFHGFCFAWKDDAPGQEIWQVNKPGCAQIVEVIRNDGKKKILFEKRIPAVEGK